MKKPLVLFSGGAAGGDHIEARRDLLRLWASDYWAFLTGRDVDGTPMIVTQDEIDDKKPLKAFPTDKPYLHALARELMGPYQIILVDKSRQMMVSTLCMQLIYWTLLFKRSRVCFLSKQIDKEAQKMMRMKMRGVHERTPEWFQTAMPIHFGVEAARATRTGSELFCVSQNAGATAFKGNTASIILIDEAAEQDNFEVMLEGAQPMAARIWAVTTALSGKPGAAFFRMLSTEPTMMETV